MGYRKSGGKRADHLRWGLIKFTTPKTRKEEGEIRPGMTQQEVADLMGISYQNVQQIERSAIQKLQQAFGVLRVTKVPGSGGRGRRALRFTLEDTPEAAEWRRVLQNDADSVRTTLKGDKSRYVVCFPAIRAGGI